MSCEQNIFAEENAFDKFDELYKTDVYFSYRISSHLFASDVLFIQKEYGRGEFEALTTAFDILWAYDAAAMHYDVRSAVERYISNSNKENFIRVEIDLNTLEMKGL